MIESLGRRLSLFFDRPGVDGDEDPTGGQPGEAPLQPMVDFVAFAADCILSGRLRLEAERLTDMLNDHEELRLVDVMAQSLDRPDAVEVTEVVVPRDELFIVNATGPRGNRARRTRTRQTFVEIKIGAYLVRGYLHAFPGLDAVAGIRHRTPMVPLTDAVIEYAIGGMQQSQRLGAVIVNRDAIERIGAAVEEEGATLDLPMSETNGPLVKDFTGDIVADPHAAA